MANSLFPQNVNKLGNDNWVLHNTRMYCSLVMLKYEMEHSFHQMMLVVVSISNDICSPDQRIIPNSNPSRLKILQVNQLFKVGSFSDPPIGH